MCGPGTLHTRDTEYLPNTVGADRRHSYSLMSSGQARPIRDNTGYIVGRVAADLDNRLKVGLMTQVGELTLAPPHTYTCGRSHVAPPTHRPPACSRRPGCSTVAGLDVGSTRRAWASHGGGVARDVHRMRRNQRPMPSRPGAAPVPPRCRPGAAPVPPRPMPRSAHT